MSEHTKVISMEYCLTDLDKSADLGARVKW